MLINYWWSSKQCLFGKLTQKELFLRRKPRQMTCGVLQYGGLYNDARPWIVARTRSHARRSFMCRVHVVAGAQTQSIVGYPGRDFDAEVCFMRWVSNSMQVDGRGIRILSPCYITSMVLTYSTVGGMRVTITLVSWSVSCQYIINDTVQLEL